MIVLQNKFISVSLDPAMSYAISALGEPGKPSLVNTADKGRLVQDGVWYNS